MNINVRKIIKVCKSSSKNPLIVNSLYQTLETHLPADHICRNNFTSDVHDLILLLLLRLEHKFVQQRHFRCPVLVNSELVFIVAKLAIISEMGETNESVITTMKSKTEAKSHT